MDRAHMERELLHIKRRRIEIRAARATLDMEDLDLDTRQSTLEHLIRTASQLSLSSSIRNETTERSALPLFQPHIQTSPTSSPGVANLSSQPQRPVSVKSSLTQSQQKVTANQDKQFKQEDHDVELLLVKAIGKRSDDSSIVNSAKAPCGGVNSLSNTDGTGSAANGKRKHSPICRASPGQLVSSQPPPGGPRSKSEPQPESDVTAAASKRARKRATKKRKRTFASDVKYDCDRDGTAQTLDRTSQKLSSGQDRRHSNDERGLANNTLQARDMQHLHPPRQPRHPPSRPLPPRHPRYTSDHRRWL